MWNFSRKKSTRVMLFKIILTMLVISLFPQVVQASNPPYFPFEMDDIHPPNTTSPFVDENELLVNSESNLASASAGRASSPDDYGYTWDELENVEWVDATQCTNTNMTGGSKDKATGPIPIGFDFPFYEQSVSQVFIAAAGYLSFTEANTWLNQSQIPTMSEPNQVVAPYWAPLYLLSDPPGGQVYYHQGGEAHERYFVVEWVDVAGGAPGDATGGDDTFHFEVILYENGDILFQYGQMTILGSSYCGAAGIENATGADGLAYLPFCAPPPSNRSVRFSRPGPSARVSLTPAYQSQFIIPGETLVFPLKVQNLGDLTEEDTFELMVSSDWSFQIIDAVTSDPLSDSNGDENPDTGPLQQKAVRQLAVEVSAPITAGIGDGVQPTVTATSTTDGGVSQVVNLQAAVPAQFSQIFRDDSTGAMSLQLNSPQEMLTKPISDEAWWGYNPAILETKGGNYLSLWQRWRYTPFSDVLVSEIEWALLDNSGSVLKPITRLTDHTAASLQIYDEDPVMAMAPDGSIGVAWRRRIFREAISGIQENWNVYFAILNAQGELQYGPTNLTGNTGWFQSQPLVTGVPRFWDIRITANRDNHFALAWHQRTMQAPSEVCTSGCALDDIYITIRNNRGEVVKPITALTADTASGGEGYSKSNVTALGDGRFFVVYNHSLGGLGFFALDSLGNLLRQSYFGQSGWSPRVIQPHNSNSIFIAWTVWTANNPQIKLVVLDSETFLVKEKERTLTNPLATTGGDFPSLTTDSQGHVILTWMDFSASYRHHLYYALFDQDGITLNSPMVFYMAKESTNGAMHVETGFTGYSATQNRHFLDVPVTYWSSDSIEKLYYLSISAGCQLDPPQFCPDSLVLRDQIAVFLERGINGAEFDPGEASGTVYEDVHSNDFAAAWIETLAQDGITDGCGNGFYCPKHPVTRAQMAIFLLRAKYGAEYEPDDVGVSTGFEDVLPSDFAAAWIKQLAAEGITAGCGNGNFCPEQAVTRGQMAVFLVRTFNLP